MSSHLSASTAWLYLCPCPLTVTRWRQLCPEKIVGCCGWFHSRGYVWVSFTDPWQRWVLGERRMVLVEVIVLKWDVDKNEKRSLVPSPAKFNFLGQRHIMRFCHLCVCVWTMSVPSHLILCDFSVFLSLQLCIMHLHCCQWELLVSSSPRETA